MDEGESQRDVLMTFGDGWCRFAPRGGCVVAARGGGGGTPRAAGRVRRAPVALLLGEGAPDGGLRVACRCSEWLVVLVALTASFFGAAAGRVAIVDWVRGACHFGLHRQAAPPASIVGSA